jgi:hypothetical protein
MSFPKTNILRRKPIRLAFDINQVRRVKTEDGTPCRLVEGYSYVNAWVGDGYNLTREAMVAATDDYNRWGAVREMHQPSAVGRASGSVKILNEEDAEEEVTLGVSWDGKGATCRSLIVDPTAMVKLDTGVYKAYSVGVAPVMMRGVDVIQCKWIENSLCDRPADPDALLTLIRSEAADMDAELEVVQVVERSSFSEYTDKLRNWALDDVVNSACYYLMDCLWEAIRANSGQGDLTMAEQSIDEFASYLKEMLAQGGPGLARAEALIGLVRTRLSSESAETLSRFSTLEGDLTRATQRATQAEAEATTLRAEVAASRERIAELEKLPDPTQSIPVRTTERSVAPFREPEPGNPTEVEALRSELAELQRTAPQLPTDKERAAAATKINRLRRQLQDLGVAA